MASRALPPPVASSPSSSPLSFVPVFDADLICLAVQANRPYGPLFYQNQEGETQEAEQPEQEEEEPLDRTIVRPIEDSSVSYIKVLVPVRGRTRRKSSAFGSAPRFPLQNAGESPGPAHENAPIISSVVLPPSKLGITMKSKLLSPQGDITPSPGPIYQIPSTIGAQAPAFTMGAPLLPDASARDRPGPGEYEAPLESGPAMSFLSALPTDVDRLRKIAALTPGPGENELPTGLSSQGRSIAHPLTALSQFETPGAGSYDLPTAIGEGPAKTMGGHLSQPMVHTPGPGEYEVETSANAPSVSIGVPLNSFSNSRGPAPNAYNLPSSLANNGRTMGSVLPTDVDDMIRRAPLASVGLYNIDHHKAIGSDSQKSTIGVPREDLARLNTPAPGEYEVKYQDQGPSHRIMLPRPIDHSTISPGPAMYEIPTGSDGPSYTMGLPTRPLTASETPGVGEYQIADTLGSDAPQYSMGAKIDYEMIRLMREADRVGPGEYSTEHWRAVGTEAPSHSIAHKQVTDDSTISPGPAVYSEEAARAFAMLNQGPSYSIAQRTASALDRELLAKANFPGVGAYFVDHLPSAFDEASQPYEANCEYVEIPVSAKLSPRAIQIIRESAARKAFLQRASARIAQNQPIPEEE